MSYQEDCQAYAIFGNPAGDAARYEENARYDYHNELREEFRDTADEYEEESRIAMMTAEERAIHDKELREFAEESDRRREARLAALQIEGVSF